MFEKLASVQARYDQLMTEMAEPAVQGDSTKFRGHSKALAEIQLLVEQFRAYKSDVANIVSTAELMQDPDMRALAQEELRALEQQRDALVGEIKVLMVPKDPNDEQHGMLGMRGGTGGDEAALCASDLFRMYSRYAERKGWKMESMNLTD